MEPWRYSVRGINVSLRVTPRGGRDSIDGIDTLANGRTVIKVRVRAIADGGEANRAVIKLLSKALGVPLSAMRIAAGVTSRIKQVEIDGDPRILGQRLAACATGTNERKDRAV
jgi:uncharacterized protein (TIGR00251 family)